MPDFNKFVDRLVKIGNLQHVCGVFGLVEAHMLLIFLHEAFDYFM